MSATMLAAALLGLPLAPVQQAPPPGAEGASIDFRQTETPHGLRYVEAFQAPRRLTQIDGVGCAQTTPPGGMYLQFEAPREMIRPGQDTLTFEVEVYDGDPHPFMLEVESNTPVFATGDRYFRVISTVNRHGKNEWRWVRWQVTDPAFCDPAREAVRFRFYDEAWWNDGRLLSVSQVRMTHEAVVFRPREDAVLCGQRMPVTVEALDKAGRPLPDGTQVRLSYRPAGLLAEPPTSVTLKGGKADFEVVAGPKPGTVWLAGLAPGAVAWATKPLFILASETKLEERTDLVTGDQLAAAARFESGALAGSDVSTFTDDQGQVALRARCAWKPDADPGRDTRLVLDTPIAGVPRRFRVYLGCPDQSVDCAWLRIRDRDGELFPYCLEPRMDERPLPDFAERGLECRALAGPSYVEGPGSVDGVIDPPCSLYVLEITAMPGCREAEVDVWGVETDVLAPAQPGTAPPAPKKPK